MVIFSSDDYVHGTDPEEQRRLSRLNALLNGNSLGAMGLRENEHVLDVGSGLGQFTRLLARKVGPGGKVLGIERSAEQMIEARRQARDDGEEHLLDVRQGSAHDLPLDEDELGTFDVAHSRFLLEHVTDPLAVVCQMVRAVRPGGRIVLEDDDHKVLRLWPEPPGLLELWRAYYLTYEHQGKDPFVGRHLIKLLHQAGAIPRRNRCLDFGSCAGNPNFEAMVENFIGIMDGARDEMVSFNLSDHDRIDAALEEFRNWSRCPDASLWYTTSWAEGVRPGQKGEDRPTPRPKSLATPSRTPIATAMGEQDEAALLRFLMDSAVELGSSLELDMVFHKIATEIRPFIDYHLFCIQLWNEEEQILENSFSMKYGKAIPQKGGFPLGYGICGNAAATRRSICVGNVTEDSRYVRVRHPEVEIHSELAVPLVFKDRLIGVLDLESTEFNYFTESNERLVSALAVCMATALANARLYEKVREDELRMERDLSTARKIQRGLLPETNPRFRRLEIGAATRPARELGGDFYDFMVLGDGRLAFAVGDVAGKATPAALLGSMAVGLLRAHFVEDPRQPAEMLIELNNHFLSVGGDNRFVAMTYGTYDETESVLHLANAGFPRPLLLRDGLVEEIDLVGRPLGMFPDSEYQEQRIEVRAGDIAVFCSDGVMECENGSGESFDTSMLPLLLQKLAKRSAEEIAYEVNAEAERFVGGHTRQLDDYTVLVLKVTGDRK
jgi:serine phosphatase RsbU (regulator of sigma subunit)/SAM-dependent methyltransferase